MQIVKAGQEDIVPLVYLINSAYRGISAKKGWTHEADLVEGESRTDKEMLEEIINDKNSVLLILKANNYPVGCIHLKIIEKELYLGMLTVSPDKQGLGFGKRLLAAAEVHGINNGCRRIYMTVISVRQKLISWYLRHGYSLSGKQQPFPDDIRYGHPVQPLIFLELEKKMLTG